MTKTYKIKTNKNKKNKKKQTNRKAKQMIGIMHFLFSFSDEETKKKTPGPNKIEAAVLIAHKKYSSLFEQRTQANVDSFGSQTEIFS